MRSTSLAVMNARASLPVLLLAAAAVSADVTYSFACITPATATTVAASCSVAEAQARVVVSDPGSNQVLFTFSNLGPGASSITDLYFDDGTLLGIASVIGGSGVSFSQLAAPGNLPGGFALSPPFTTTAGFSADSDPPVAPNGVNPGESVSVLFNLLAGQTFADTLGALELGGAAGGLRIGLHVQALDGGSVSLVNSPTPVPLPAAVWLLLSGIAGIGAVARRRAPAR